MLVAVGLGIRLRVADSAEFTEVRREGRTLRSPMRHLLRHHWRVVLLGTAATFVCHAAYIVTSFLPAYATTTLGMPPGAALAALVVGSTLSMGALTVVARRADSVDRRWFAVAGGLLAASWVPGLPADSGAGGRRSRRRHQLRLAFGSVQYAVVPALLAERFPVNVRCSGVSACFQLSAVLGGALLPVGASWAVGAAGGHYWPAALLMAAAGLVTALGAASMPPVDGRAPGRSGVVTPRG